MFKMNCLLLSSLAKACRQLSLHPNINGSTICGLQRSFCLSATRLQDAAESTAPSTTSEESRKDFSLLPPLPGQDSPLRWEGKKFEELPIAHIKATYNNTHIQLTDSLGQSVVWTSCGTEGFKNSRKSTPLAAQTAGMAAAAKAKVKGIKFIRVVIKGLGPGRQSAIKGLTMGGLQVISLTDNTPVPHNGCRPRKARRV